MALNDQWHCHPWKLWPYLVPHNLSIGSIFQIDNQNLIHFSLSGNLSAFLSYWQRKSITDWKRHLNLLDLDKGCDLQSSRVTAMEMSLLKVIKVDTGIGGKGKGWQHKFITLMEWLTTHQQAQVVAVKIFSPYNVFNSYSRRDQLSNCKKVLFVKLAFVGAAERMVRMILVFRGAALHLAAMLLSAAPGPHRTDTA